MNFDDKENGYSYCTLCFKEFDEPKLFPFCKKCVSRYDTKDLWKQEYGSASGKWEPYTTTADVPQASGIRPIAASGSVPALSGVFPTVVDVEYNYYNINTDTSSPIDKKQKITQQKKVVKDYQERPKRKFKFED